MRRSLLTRRRLWLGLGALGAAFIAVLAMPAQSASAHPLGNFTVNQALALNLYANRVDVTGIMDLAELPTLQEKPTVAAEGNAGYNASTCKALAAADTVTVNGQKLTWTVRPTGFSYRPGSAGLHISRITCALSAPADLSAASTVTVSMGYRSDRIGWREITAVGHTVHLINPSVPSVSPSKLLLSYPNNLLGSPLNVRSATLSVQPGAGPVQAGPKTHVNNVDPATRFIDNADTSLEGLVGNKLTPLIGLLGVILSILLGAGHAALPGHGKTVMAAYMAGKAGRPRDAIVVGATVTATHTGGVIVLGLLLTSAASVAGEAVLGWLGVASGILVAIVGVTMLAGILRRRRRGESVSLDHGHSHGFGGHSHSHGPDHSHGPGHSHDHGDSHDHGAGHAHGAGHDHSAGHDHDHADAHEHAHEHEHEHGGVGVLVAEREQDHEPDHAHEHGHEHPHPHPKSQPQRSRAGKRLGLVGMGVAGGLVPSPSALIVLLGAIGLGRTWFGVLLVIAYGIGMAGTLTAAGLLLVRLRNRLPKRSGRLAARITQLLPTGSALLVLCVGIGLAARAALTIA